MVLDTVGFHEMLVLVAVVVKWWWLALLPRALGNAYLVAPVT